MSTDWDLAIGVYLAVGAVLLLVIYGHHRLTRVERSDWVQAALRASDPERHTLGYRVMAEFVAPALAAVFIWALWPAALSLIARWRRVARGDEGKMEEKQFEPVESSSLIQRFTVDQIEKRELVHDPMQAAPFAPFGHLGAQWQAFRSALQPQDEFWSYCVIHTDEWGIERRTRGYAAIRDGLIVSHFVCGLSKHQSR